ncbi:MAG: hypothetical protein ACLVCH_13940 [Roseburia inulinivorans]
MDYQFQVETMLPFSGEDRRKKSKKMLSCLGGARQLTEKGEDSSIMPENAHIRWDWCSPEMFRLKVMMSGEITAQAQMT